ncbi:MAG: hypothetical protein ACM3SY_16445 [Candidatus Omnitrophota bacterium]
MNASGSITVSLSALELDRIVQARSDISPGDKLDGKVLEIRSDGKAVIDFGTFQAVVELNTPVNQGDSLHLVVVEKGKQLKLKIESIEPAEPGPADSKPPVDAGASDIRVDELRGKLDRLLQQQAAAQEPVSPGQSTKPEDVQVIYENIKSAIRFLQNRLQESGVNIDLPPAIETIFHGVQADLKIAEMSDAILQQLNQLKTLIENSGSSNEKLTAQWVKTLSDILNRLSELKAGNQFQEMGTLLRDKLTNELSQLELLFNEWRTGGDMANAGKFKEVLQTVKTLQHSIEIALAPPSASPETELSPEIRNLWGNVLSHSGNLKDSITVLTRNIETLLQKLPDSVPRPASSPDSAVGAETALPAKIRTLLSTVHAHFEPLDISENVQQLAPRLKLLVENSGVFFEKRIADAIAKFSETSAKMQDIPGMHQIPEIRHIIENDLKPNLLQLREFLTNELANRQAAAATTGDSGRLESVRAAVDELLNNISGQQERAVLENRANPQEPVHAFTFQVPLKGQENAELKIFYNKSKSGKKKGQDDAYKLSLLLQMSELGDVRSDFFYLKKDLSITFFVEEPRIRDFFNAHLDEISQLLKAECNHLNMDIVVSREKVLEFEASEKEAETVSDQAVNIKV